VPAVTTALETAYKVHYEGTLPRKGPYLLFAKHQGELDHFFIGMMIHKQTGRFANYMMRKFPFPLYCFLKTHGGILVVRSKDVKDGQYTEQERQEINDKAATYALSRLKLGEPLVNFPEGTRAYKQLHTPFKMWIAEKIIQAQENGDLSSRIPIVPLGIEYEDANKLRSHVWVRAGEPFYTNNTSELETHLQKEISRLSGL